MNGVLKNPKDFWAGLIFVGFGLAFAWVGHGYPMGSTQRMGPGLFPFALALTLAGLGLVIMVRSLLVAGEPVGGLNLKGLVLIILAAVLFGVLIDTAGLIVAVVAGVLVGSAASIHFRLRTAALGALVLAGLCSLVFVYALGLPIQLVGPWLGF